MAAPVARGTAAAGGESPFRPVVPLLPPVSRSEDHRSHREVHEASRNAVRRARRTVVDATSREARKVHADAAARARSIAGAAASASAQLAGSAQAAQAQVSGAAAAAHGAIGAAESAHESALEAWEDEASQQLEEDAEESADDVGDAGEDRARDATRGVRDRRAEVLEACAAAASDARSAPTGDGDELTRDAKAKVKRQVGDRASSDLGAQGREAGRNFDRFADDARTAITDAAGRLSEHVADLVPPGQRAIQRAGRGGRAQIAASASQARAAVDSQAASARAAIAASASAGQAQVQQRAAGARAAVHASAGDTASVLRRRGAAQLRTLTSEIDDVLDELDDHPIPRRKAGKVADAVRESIDEAAEEIGDGATAGRQRAIQALARAVEQARGAIVASAAGTSTSIRRQGAGAATGLRTAASGATQRMAAGAAAARASGDGIAESFRKAGREAATNGRNELGEAAKDVVNKAQETSHQAAGKAQEGGRQARANVGRGCQLADRKAAEQRAKKPKKKESLGTKLLNAGKSLASKIGDWLENALKTVLAYVEEHFDDLLVQIGVAIVTTGMVIGGGVLMATGVGAVPGALLIGGAVGLSAAHSSAVQAKRGGWHFGRDVVGVGAVNGLLTLGGSLKGLRLAGKIPFLGPKVLTPLAGRAAAKLAPLARGTASKLSAVAARLIPKPLKHLAAGARSQAEKLIRRLRGSGPKPARPPARGTPSKPSAADDAARRGARARRRATAERTADAIASGPLGQVGTNLIDRKRDGTSAFTGVDRAAALSVLGTAGGRVASRAIARLDRILPTFGTRGRRRGDAAEGDRRRPRDRRHGRRIAEGSADAGASKAIKLYGQKHVEPLGPDSEEDDRRVRSAPPPT